MIRAPLTRTCPARQALDAAERVLASRTDQSQLSTRPVVSPPTPETLDLELPDELSERVGYVQSSAMLTEWKRSEDLAFLAEVSSVPLQQALRHLQGAFAAFFDKRARYPQFKSRKKSHGCGTKHDRDVNAARNIRAEGLSVLACGGGVRPQPGNRGGQSPMKQEPQRVTAGIPVL